MEYHGLWNRALSSVCRGKWNVIAFMVIIWKSCEFPCRQVTYQVYCIYLFFKYALGPHSGIIHTSGSLRKVPACCVTWDIFHHMLFKWIFLALWENSRILCRDSTRYRKLSQPFLETSWFWLQPHRACQQLELHWIWAVCHEPMIKCELECWLLVNTSNSGHTSALSFISLHIRLYI